MNGTHPANVKIPKQIPYSNPNPAIPAIPRRSGCRMRHAKVPPTTDHPHIQTVSSDVDHHQNNGLRSKTVLRIWLIILLKHEKRPYFWVPYILVGNWL